MMFRKIYRRFLCTALLGCMALSFTGCGSSAEKEEDTASVAEEETGTEALLTGELTAEDDAALLIDTANAAYLEQKKRGSAFTNVYTYDDGFTEQVTGDALIDCEQELLQFTYQSEEEGEILNLSAKTEGRCYTYERGQDGSWIRYAQSEDEDGLTSLEAQLSGELFTISEEDGFKDIAYSNEGVEEFDGSQAVRVKVTASQEFETSSEAITYSEEDILNDYATTKEVVDALGLSELLSQYLDQLNRNSMTVPTEYETNIWIDVTSHLPLQIQNIRLNGEEKTDGLDALQEFADQSWMIETAQGCLDAGGTMEEALALVEENREEQEALLAEESAAYEEEYAEESYTDHGEVMRTEETERIVYGEECVTATELPADVKTITEAQYMNGDY